MEKKQWRIKGPGTYLEEKKLGRAALEMTGLSGLLGVGLGTIAEGVASIEKYGPYGLVKGVEEVLAKGPSDVMLGVGEVGLVLGGASTFMTFAEHFSQNNQPFKSFLVTQMYALAAGLEVGRYLGIGGAITAAAFAEVSTYSMLRADKAVAKSS